MSNLLNRRARLDRLLELVVDHEHLSVDQVVEQLGVSAATARRDLDALASQQLVVRTHGGASVNPDARSLPLRYRASENGSAKEAIARCAADLMEPGSVIGMNGGTTTTALAHELGAREAIREHPDATTLVTNAVNIAHDLAVRKHLQLVVTGGLVRESSYELVGTWAEQLLANVHIHTLFLGVNAVNATDGALTHNEAEATMSAHLAARSERVVVVADGSKIGQRAFARICSASGISDVVTDASAPAAELEALRGVGVRVHLAHE